MQMRVYCLSFVALVVLVGYPAARGWQDRPTDSPEALAVAQEVDAAWNARDAARFSRVFTEDASFAFPIEGTFLRGREEIRLHYAKQFPTFPPDWRHVYKPGPPDLIGPNISATDGEVDIVGTDPKTGKPNTVLRHYRSFSLAVRTESGWRIRVARVYSVPK